MSFLQRLKNRGVRSGQASLQSDSEETAVDKVAQLDVDVYQTEKMIVIYAQSSGADMNDVNVSIEGDADIVLIEGRRIRPDYLVFSKRKSKVPTLRRSAYGVIFTVELFYQKVLI
jgi:HSP20 family molecular chaperone IbpA